MRNGRSQRKARASLPPRTTRTKPSHAELGTSDSAPQVVIGMAGPRQDADPGGPGGSDVETRTRSERSERSEQTVSAGRSKKPTLEILAEPTLELFREVERDAEPARTGLPTVEAVEPMTAELLKLESAAYDESPGPRITAPASDEMSIPPVGDLAVEPIADRFFSEGEIVAARASADAHQHEHEWAEVVARESRKSLPEVVERRARLSKYVRWAVGGAAVLCLAALGRTIVSPTTHASAPAASSLSERLQISQLSSVSAAAHVEAPEPKAAAAAVATAAPTTPSTAEPAAAEPAAAAPAVAAEPAKMAELAAAPAAEPTSPKAEAPAGDKTALEEKNDARRALERGKAADSIAAGERSVALDPTDGEAWLILGAAYQDRGNMVDARRAYTACTKAGTHGPIGECRAMLR